MPSPLTLPVPYTRHQPPVGTPIRASAPLARGLAFLAPFNEGAGNPRDIISRARGTLEGGATWVAAPFGHGVRSTGALGSDANFGALPAITALTALSVAVWVAPQDGARCDVFGEWHASAGRQHFLLIGGLVSGKWQFYASANGTSSVGTATGPTTYVVGRRYHLVGVNDGATTTRLYVDGALEGTASLSGTYTPSPEPIRLGGSADAGANVVVAAATIYRRALTPGEVRSLYLAPFGMF